MKRENESQRGVSRREMLMRGGSAVAAAGIGPSIAAAAQNPSPTGGNGRSPTRAKHGRASRRGGGHLDQRSDDRQSRSEERRVGKEC